MPTFRSRLDGAEEVGEVDLKAVDATTDVAKVKEPGLVLEAAHCNPRQGENTMAAKKAAAAKKPAAKKTSAKKTKTTAKSAKTSKAPAKKTAAKKAPAKRASKASTASTAE